LTNIVGGSMLNWINCSAASHLLCKVHDRHTCSQH